MPATSAKVVPAFFTISMRAVPKSLQAPGCQPESRGCLQHPAAWVSDFLAFAASLAQLKACVPVRPPLDAQTEGELDEVERKDQRGCKADDGCHDRLQDGWLQRSEAGNYVIC